jgi:NADPH2:quinone reductase
MLTMTRPATFRPSIASWASATLSSGNRASISKPGHPSARASLSAPAAVFASAGKPSRVFRFEDIREAHRVMESNEASGKLVVIL